MVRVHKDGYDSHEQNRLSFEVANPYEQNYYIPNANSPVVFRLRRRGPGVELIKHSVEVMLQGAGATAAVDLSTGKVSANGELQISAWKPCPSQPMLPHYDWKVVMKINRGGFVDAPTEFAFEAPDISYDMPVEITMRATDRDNWCVSVERTAYFAFGEPKKYGSLHLRTSANSRYVFIDYVLNPSGSRNLEQRSEHAQGAEP